MKVVKSTKEKRVYFIRNIERGYFRIKKSGEPISMNADNFVNDEENVAHSKSMINKLLKKQSDNTLYSFIESLVCQEEINYTSLDALKANPENDYIKKMRENLSFFALNLKTPESRTFKDILIDYYKKDNKQEIQEIQKVIKTLVNKKKERIVRSIHNNKIPFQFDNDGLKPTTEKMKFLFGLLDNDIDKIESKFTDFWKLFDYSSLYKKGIKDIISKYPERNGQIKDKCNLNKQIYIIVCNRCYEVLQQISENQNDKITEYKFFNSEIKNHFKRYLPVKQKGEATKRLKKLNKKSVQYFCSEKYVFSQLKNHIINQLVQGLILYGKLCKYIKDLSEDKFKSENQITSEDLIQIQIEEAFKKQFFLSLSIATSRLYYLYNFYNNASNTEKDIFSNRHQLLCKILNEQKEKISIVFKMKSYFPIAGESNDETIWFLSSVLNSVYYIRNHIFHYKKGEIQDIFSNKDYLVEIDENLTKFSNKKNDYRSVIEKITLDFYKRDFESINECFKEQIRSTGIANFYSFEILQNIFSGSVFDFGLSNEMLPSFKKVFERGCNLKKSDNNNFVNWMEEFDVLKGEVWQTYRNLLRLIYYHCFIPEVRKNESLILDCIDDVIKWNKEVAEKNQSNKNEDKYRYKDMPAYKTSLSEFMRELKREQSLRESDENYDKSEKGNYYLDFICDITVMAFEKYLDKKLDRNNLNIIKLSEPQKNTSDEAKVILDKLFEGDIPVLKIETSLPSNQLEYMVMYPFLKLLDNSELNDLRHQFIKYRSSLEDLKEVGIAQKRSEDINALKKIEELITLIMFTSSNQLPNAENDDIKDYINVYLKEDIEKYGTFYQQSDNETPVLYKGISQIIRTGTKDLYSKMFAETGKYKITVNEYEQYKSKEQNIADCQKKLKELHKTLSEKKSKDSKDFKEYKNLLIGVQKYNNLKNKLTFNNLYKLYKIHMALLGRLASFAQDWERDMYFMLTALKEEQKIRIDVEEIFKKGNIVSKIDNNLNYNDKKLFAFLCWRKIYTNLDDIKNDISIRNYVAHLNHLNKTDISIIEIINQLRVLLAYDIKRQNAVTKAVQKLFKDYKFIITFKPVKIEKDKNDNEVKFTGNLESDQIDHLKNLNMKDDEKIFEWANSKLLTYLISQLLEYKKCEPKSNGWKTNGYMRR